MVITGKAYAFTRRYCAPEIQNGSKRNRKSDVFPLGCVFVDILTVLEPQPDIKSLGDKSYFALINELRNALDHLRVNNLLWGEIVRITIGMLEPDVNGRPSAIDLLDDFKTLESAMYKPKPRYFCDSCASMC